MLLPGAPPPTLESLLKHVKKFGLDNSASGYRGKPGRYTGAKAFFKDSAVEIAIRSLGPRAFVFFVEGVGYANYRKEALEEWHRLRGTTPEDV